MSRLHRGRRQLRDMLSDYVRANDLLPVGPRRGRVVSHDHDHGHRRAERLRRLPRAIVYFLDNELDDADCAVVRPTSTLQPVPGEVRPPAHREVRSSRAPAPRPPPTSCASGCCSGSARSRSASPRPEPSRHRHSNEPPAGSAGGSVLPVLLSSRAQALGRLPWFAPFFLRARRLRPVLPMVTSWSIDVSPGAARPSLRSGSRTARIDPRSEPGQEPLGVDHHAGHLAGADHLAVARCAGRRR